MASLPAFGQNPQTFLAAVGKDPRMIVHNAVTGVVETPLHLLREHLVTPKELLFVRNNQVLPGSMTLSPYPATDWELELSGLVAPAMTVGFSDLAGIEQSEVVAVLQCAGNGRAFYSQTAMAKGTQWQRGGMGQIRWKGVRLKQLLDSSGLMVDEDARFLTAEGRDSPASSDDDYEQSVPLADVLETALLATHMNGESIPAIHGGPLRLVLPGYYGSMNVKWVSRLRFEKEASTSRHHAQRYRTFRERIEPGSAPEVRAETTHPTWRQKVKSVIWNPVNNERRLLGPLTVSGVSWNDGRTEIVAIENIPGRRKHLAASEPRGSSQPLRLVSVEHDLLVRVETLPRRGRHRYGIPSASVRRPGQFPAGRWFRALEPLRLRVVRGRQRQDIAALTCRTHHLTAAAHDKKAVIRVSCFVMRKAEALEKADMTSLRLLAVLDVLSPARASGSRLVLTALSRTSPPKW